MWKRLNQLCTEGAKEMIYLRHHLLMQAVFCFCFFLVNKILIALLTLWAVFCTATLAVFLHPQLWACSVSSCVLNVCTVLPVTWWSWGGATTHTDLSIHVFDRVTVDFFCPPTADSLTLGTVCESTGGVIDDVILLCFPVSYYSMQKSKTSPRWNITIIHQPVLNLLWQIKKSV